MLASKEAQSRGLRRSLGSVFRRLNDCDGGNLIRINTNTCEHVINGKRQCKVLISGRTTNDSYTREYYPNRNGMVLFKMIRVCSLSRVDNYRHDEKGIPPLVSNTPGLIYLDCSLAL